MPVAEAPDVLDRVVEVVGHSSVAAISGFGQVNGFELVFRGGGRLLYGARKGRADSLRLGDRECITRIAGRTDAGRRQRGASRDSPKRTLVSLQVTTSKAREVIFGIAYNTRMEGSFSFLSEYRSEIIGLRTLAPDVPIVTSILTQPRALASLASVLPTLPLVSSATAARAAAARTAPVRTLSPSHSSSSFSSASSSSPPLQREVPAEVPSDGMARGEAHMRAIVDTVASMEERVRSLRSSSRPAAAPSAAAIGWRSASRPESEHAAGERAGADWGRLEAEQTLVRQHLDSLIELQTCKVCLDRSIAGVIVPCGHLVLCLECASHLKVGSACPICREPATAFSLTFSA